MASLISEIKMFAFPDTMRTWIPCDGRTLNASKYPGLFQMIGVTFGGDANNFKVPDLRDRVLIGNGPARPEFASGGEEKHGLTLDEMPGHRHQAVASTNVANSPTPAGHYWPANAGYVTQSNDSMGDQAVQSVGFGIPHDNMSPYLAVNYAICAEGVLRGAEAYIGDIKAFASNKGIDLGDWFPCDGRLLDIKQYETLYSVILTTYGGDGTTHFAIPDLRGRAPVCWVGNREPAQGLHSYKPGETAGEENVKLTTAQMPRHYHPAQASLRGNSLRPDKNVWANEDGRPAVNGFASELGTGVNMNPAALGESGKGKPHNNMMPFQAIGYWICSHGLYPTRT